MTRRVIVTRPAAQAGTWMHRIQSAGIETALIPALEIIPLEDIEHIAAIKDAVQGLDAFRFLIFVSQNAVALAFDWIEDYWPQFPRGVECLAIGAKTAAAIRERIDVLTAGITQDSTHATMTSEELLSSACLQDVGDKKILIFRGAGGRPTLYDELRRRGARVQYCELYERKLPEASLATLMEAKIDPYGDILTIFSGESLENFHFLLDKAKIPAWQKIPLVVPSARVGKQAREFGFERIAVANNASEDEMWLALRQALEGE